MKKAAKEITPAEEIIASTEEIVAEAKEEATEAPSRLHEIWKRAGTLFFQAPTNRIWASDLSEAIAREGRPPVIKNSRCDELPNGKPVGANNN